MSEKFNEIICSFLDDLERTAKQTKSPVDDIVLKFLQSICDCKCMRL